MSHATPLTSVLLLRWFHGKISRDEAENLLLPKNDGLFLVRESTNFPGDYTLCVCFQAKVSIVVSDYKGEYFFFKLVSLVNKSAQKL